MRSLNKANALTLNLKVACPMVRPAQSPRETVSHHAQPMFSGSTCLATPVRDALRVLPACRRVGAPKGQNAPADSLSMGAADASLVLAFDRPVRPFRRATLRASC
jgi:hypothetical protein